MIAVLITVGSALGVLALLVAKSLFVDEVRGRIADHYDEVVERAIAMLSPEDQEAFAEDWRASYARQAHRPLSAARAAREFRLSSERLALEVEPVPIPTGGGTASAARAPAQRKRRRRVRRRRTLQRSVRDATMWVAIGATAVIVTIAMFRALALWFT